jgi:cytochrome oxidase Cu insertion factor (SCO1/SenC/PrrC family)
MAVRRLRSGQEVSQDVARSGRTKRGIMRNVTLCLGVLLAASLLFGEEARLGPTDGQDLPPAALERVQVGTSAPDFTLESKDGDLITLSGYRGKKNVVLVFYRGYW